MQCTLPFVTKQGNEILSSPRGSDFSFGKTKEDCMIKNIILDVGKVLVAWEPEDAMKQFGFDDKTV